MSTTRLTVLLAGTVLVCVPIAQNTAQVRVTTSTGEVSVYTEKNLTDHMIVVDSVELEMAQVAVSRTRNTTVRDFANMLISEHTGHLESLRKIAGDDDVGRQASASDTAGAAAIRVLTRLRAMPADSGLDQAYISEQIRLHSQEIIALEMFGGAAKDDDLQDEVKKTLPLLERHLARAREVAAQLGMSVDTTAAPTPATTRPTTTTTKP